MDTSNAFVRRLERIAEQTRKAQRHTDPTVAELARLAVDEAIGELRKVYGDGFDVNLRARIDHETILESRAVGATARSSVTDRSFADAFMGALVEFAPLTQLATILTTSTAEEMTFASISTQMTAAITTDGSSITASDPTFAGSQLLHAFKYAARLVMSSEVALDAACDFERLAAERVGPICARALSTDLWGGAGSTTAPEGLLSALSTSTAASATTVVADDVLQLLAAVPSAYFNNMSLLMNPVAYYQLRRQSLGTSAAGGQAWALAADGKSFAGVPVYIEPALADPATGTKPIVAGDIRSAYLVRLCPVRIEFDSSVGFATDQVQMRTVLRADGRKLVTGAAKALVMA